MLNKTILKKIRLYFIPHFFGFLTILMIVLNLFNFKYISNNLSLYIKPIILLFALIWFTTLFINKNLLDKSDHFNKITGYLFSLSLILLICSDLDILNNFLKVKYLSFCLSLTTIALGIVLIHKRINNYDEPIKIRKINIFWEKSNIIIFLCLVIISSIVFSYKFGSFEFHEDEFQVVDAAAGVYYTNNFYKWDWLQQKSGQFTSCVLNDPACHYTRAFPHTLLITLSYKIFGINEWSSRMISVFFGVLLVLMTYTVAFYISRNRFTSVLAAFYSIFYYEYINIFRYTRMYALLLPLFLLLYYSTSKALLERGSLTKPKNTILKWIKENLNFNYYWMLALLLILVLNSLIHIVSLVILPSILLYVAYLAFSTKEKRYINLLLLTIIVISIIADLVFIFELPIPIYFISLFERSNFEYLPYVFKYPFYYTNIVILLLGLFLLNRVDKEKKNKMVFMYFIILFSLIFFIWIGNRYAGFLYISHVTVLTLILSAVILTSLVEKLNKIYQILIYVLISFVVLFSFSGHIKEIYENETNNGKYEIAYQTIEDNFKPDQDTLIAQYLRPYYLPSLWGKNIKTIDMLNNDLYPYPNFINDIAGKSGWITWETRKGYHINEDVRDYIDMNFKKYHGSGIDDTSVEVYYFNNII